MTSSCEIRFDEISITSQKEYVPAEFIYLFQESDRKSTKHIDPNEDQEEFEVGYYAKRDFILHRLDLAGYTAERVQRTFEAWLEKEREFYREYVAEREGLGGPTAAALESFNYDEWKRRAKRTYCLRDTISRDPTIPI